MPRIARLCAEDYPHHIAQRGNIIIKRLEKIFERDILPKKGGCPKKNK